MFLSHLPQRGPGAPGSDSLRVVRGPVGHGNSVGQQKTAGSAGTSGSGGMILGFIFGNSLMTKIQSYGRHGIHDDFYGK